MVRVMAHVSEPCESWRACQADPTCARQAAGLSDSCDACDSSGAHDRLAGCRCTRCMRAGMRVLSCHAPPLPSGHVTRTRRRGGTARRGRGMLGMAHVQGRALVLTGRDPWVYADPPKPGAAGDDACRDFECYFVRCA
jgi:hypothetical protein